MMRALSREATQGKSLLWRTSMRTAQLNATISAATPSSRLRKRSLSWLSSIGMAITLLAAAGSISLAMGLAGTGALAAGVFSGWMA